jgi:hypothetical protein
MMPPRFSSVNCYSFSSLCSYLLEKKINGQVITENESEVWMKSSMASVEASFCCRENAEDEL